MEIIRVSLIGRVWEMEYLLGGDRWSIAYDDEYKHYYGRGKGVFVPANPRHAPVARFILAGLVGLEYDRD